MMLVPGQVKNKLKMTTIKENKLIAEFMGWKVDGYSRKGFMGLFGKKEPHYLSPGQKQSVWAIRYYDSFFRYDISWDWLMPVVESIKSMGHDFSIVLEGDYGWCSVFDKAKGNYKVISENTEDNLIDAVYKSVIGFIEWHNSK